MTTMLLTAIVTVVALALAPRAIAWFRVGMGLRQEARQTRKRRTLDRDRARLFHDGLPASDRSDEIDDRTWRDLDMDEVLARIDRTWSAPGQQYLYHTLRRGFRSAGELHALEARVTEVAADQELARTLGDALKRLADSRALQLPLLFQGALPVRPAWWWLFPLLTLSSIVSLLLIVVWPRAVIAFIAVCAINILVQLVYKPRVRMFTPAFHAVPPLLNAARALGTIGNPAFESEAITLRDGEARLGVLRAATRWLLFEPASDADAGLTSSLYEYANLVLLLDVNAFMLGVEAVRTHRTTMRELFEAIGRIDVALSVAEWRSSLLRWCVPRFTPPAKEMGARDIVHPLVSNPVPNSLTLNGESLLVSGSNMSGKTTFLRALGINAVLAETLNTACAAEWRAPVLAVGASIGRDDSVLEGRSYYLAEVESVRRLLRAKESGKQHLFLLDELYRGTNTPERIAASAATLRYLNKGNDIVIVATHDLETLDLVGNAYVPFHFREHIENGELHFDFTLRPGPASTRNAIALLELMEYPREVVQDALRIVSEDTARDDSAR